MCGGRRPLEIIRILVLIDKINHHHHFFVFLAFDIEILCCFLSGKSSPSAGILPAHCHTTIKSATWVWPTTFQPNAFSSLIVLLCWCDNIIYSNITQSTFNLYSSVKTRRRNYSMLALLQEMSRAVQCALSALLFLHLSTDDSSSPLALSYQRQTQLLLSRINVSQLLSARSRCWFLLTELLSCFWLSLSFL